VVVHRGQRINDVFDTLNAEGVQVVSMRNRTNRLEEMFLSMVHGSEQDTTPATTRAQEEKA